VRQTQTTGSEANPKPDNNIGHYNLELYTAGVSESSWSVAFKDLLAGIKGYRLWVHLGWQDIVQRYRRSIIGPFWITLSQAILITMLGLLYGRLFKLPLDKYMPFLATGMTAWALIASLVNESCAAFTSVDSLIKQTRMPFTSHALRMVWRNLIIFAHNLVVLIPIYIIFDVDITLAGAVLFIPAVLLISLNGLWSGIILGVVSARYRDITQIAANMVQVTFFITPIMWMPEVLEGRGIARWLLDCNPAHHILAIVRSSLLGDTVSPSSWGGVILITVMAMFLSLLILGRCKKRIAYWV